MIIFIRAVQSHKLMKAMKLCARYFFSLSGELKLWISSSKHSTYQLFVFTKSDLSLISDFISLFQKPSNSLVLLYFSLDCWKKTSLLWINLPSPNHSTVKKKGKKMKTALRFYCATTKNGPILLCLIHCTALPWSLLFPSSTAEVPGPAPLLCSRAASSFCHLPYP